MKKHLLLAALLAATVTLSAQDDQRVLLTVNGEPTTVSEFLYIYNKNHQDTTNQQSLDEYLDMFINFKLKVEAAKAAGIDTTHDFLYELQNYRKQATPKYMTDPVAEEQLIRSIYDRMQTDLLISHIAIQCPYSANDSTVAVALEKIETARQRVTTGLPVTTGKGKRQKTTYTPEDFNAVAAEISEDPSIKRNNGRIGWVTPFRFVLSFEDAAYQTPIGEVSEIFRSPFGFHILKVEQALPHREVRAAHIMKMTPAGNDSAALVAKIKIDSLYNLANEGTNFFALAMANSDDRGSAQQGGDLGYFSRGQMVPEFENTAFSMTEQGQISKPVKSQYGWHIIRYDGDKPATSYEDKHNEIQQRIPKTEYRQRLDQAFVEKLKKEYHFTDNPQLLEHYKQAAAGCSSITDPQFLERIANLNETMMTIDGKAVTEQDFNEYLKKYTYSQYGSMDKTLDEKYEAFVAQQLKDKEDSELENKYPELRNLVKEYHDGILLFDVSLKEVWDKATQDTAGLKNYFLANKKNYTWSEPRYKGWIVYAKDPVSMKAAKAIIKNANSDSIESYIKQRVNMDSLLLVRYQHGLWAKGENPIVDKQIFKQKDVELTTDTAFQYVELVGKKLKAPETYEDEKGKVVSDYQDHLEQQWIAYLRRTYPYEVNMEVFESIKE